MKFILLVPDICKYDILSLKYGMKILLNLKTECLKRLSNTRICTHTNVKFSILYNMNAIKLL